MNNHYFKCGCTIKNENSSSIHTRRYVFRKCKKHRGEFKTASWNQWAKCHAPKQYADYIK